MANFVFNIAKGKVNAFHQRSFGNYPTEKIIYLFLQSGCENDDLMKDRNTLADVLSASSEASYTNYVRGEIDAATAPVVDDTADSQYSYNSAGGFYLAAQGNPVIQDIAKLIICYDPGGGDSSIIPLVAYDFVFTASGGDISGSEDPTGYFRAL